jgi:hypothetical protein
MAVLCRGAEGMSLELAQVEVTPEGSGWIRGTAALEMRRELGAEASLPGIRERGAAEGLREQWISRRGWHPGVATNERAIVEKLRGVE